MRALLRRWWRSGSTGRHSRPFNDTIDITEATIPRKKTAGHSPWSTAPQPAVCLFPDPPDDLNPRMALLRATAPRLFDPADTYWGQRYTEFFIQIAKDTAAANQLRRECGLAPRPNPYPAGRRVLPVAA